MKTYPMTLHGAIETNAYFYIDEQSGHGFLIDPGAEADKLLKTITDHQWTIEKILLTHGHFDHIGAVEKLYRELGCKYYIHIEGKNYLTDPYLNLSAYFDEAITLNTPSLLADNETIILDIKPDIRLNVIHTPGHTRGSMCIECENNLFTGDTLFCRAVGRTDLPTGDGISLAKSVDKLRILKEDCIVYPGHGVATTIGEEKKYNPWMSFR